MLREALQTFSYYLLPSLLSNFDLIPSYPPNNSSFVFQQPNATFDFIVIGAGSAGSTVADRLCEVPDIKVLLIEAGADPPLPASALMPLQPALFGSPVDWNYLAEPANDSCRCYQNNQVRIPRGKILGGTSSINGNLYNRCSPTDYDGWASMGNPGWSYEEVLPYFNKLERVEVPRWPESDKHGYSGPIYVQDFTNRTFYGVAELADFVKEYIVESGYSVIPDISLGRNAGVTIVPGTIKDEIRWSTAKGYIQPLRNGTCLTLMKETLATRILFDNKTAIGVEVLNNGTYKQIYCRKEVILSAGSINSPQLLMLSGIGPKDHLDDMGIPVVQDLPVGFNLQDHPTTYGIVAKAKFSDYKILHNPLLIMSLLLLDRIDTGFTANILTFFNTTGYSADDPNIQCLHFILPQLPFAPTNGNFITKLQSESPVFLSLLQNNKPSSRGQILLNSTDPTKPPKIIPGYFSNSTDIKVMTEGLRILRNMTNTDAFRNRAEFVPVIADECSSFPLYSDDYYDCIIRYYTIISHHFAGTCKMGPSADSEAVVSPTLQVHGINGLRVVDGSVIPRITTGNTNIPIIMLAEKASDMIKQTYDMIKQTYGYKINSA